MLQSCRLTEVESNRQDFTWDQSALRYSKYLRTAMILFNP